MKKEIYRNYPIGNKVELVERLLEDVVFTTSRTAPSRKTSNPVACCEHRMRNAHRAQGDRTASQGGLSMDDATRARGREVFREILGAEYQQKRDASTNDFNGPIRRMSEEFAYAGLWTRPGLDRKTRSLITIAMLTALNRPHEVAHPPRRRAQQWLHGGGNPRGADPHGGLLRLSGGDRRAALGRRPAAREKPALVSGHWRRYVR